MPPTLPLTGLRAFEAAARHLSFQKAAAELGVTPTAVSHAVENLEKHCGARLFRRRPRPLALTPVGEALFPVVQRSFSAIGEAVARIRRSTGAELLRVTATNAFAVRWLLPRLPLWREQYPDLRLDVIGTDAVLDLSADDADLAIRYQRTPPNGSALEARLLGRDRFHVVASPRLINSSLLPLSPRDVAALPLIACAWPAMDTEAPTWLRWEEEARRRHADTPPIADRVGLSFAEEAHAMEAAVAGQGAAICSDVLVGSELADGRLVRISDVTIPGYGFYAVWRRDNLRADAARRFAVWLDEAWKT